MHADAAGAPDRNDRICHVEHQARAIFDRAAVAVGSLVAAVLQELIEQIAIGAVNLDAVETGRLRVLGALTKRLHHARQLLGLQRSRRRVGTLRAQQAHMSLRRDGAGRNGKRAAVIARVGDASDMPQLQQHPAACRVHGVGDLPPAVDLLLRPDARSMGIPDPHRRHRGRLGNDHARAGALRVIGAHQRVRNPPRSARPVPRQRRHEDAVRKAKIADSDGLEKGRHAVRSSRWLNRAPKWGLCCTAARAGAAVQKAKIHSAYGRKGFTLLMNVDWLRPTVALEHDLAGPFAGGIALRGGTHGPGHHRGVVELLHQERDFVRQVVDVPGRKSGRSRSKCSNVVQLLLCLSVKRSHAGSS